MLNSVSLQGRLTANPELKYTQSQIPVSSFTVACDRDYVASGEKREADFINCVAWRGTAEFLSKYFSKGQMTCLHGRIQTRKWQTQDGENRYATEVVVESVNFCGSKPEGQQAPAQDAPAQEAKPQYTAPARREPEYTQQTFADADINENDLPF